MNLHEFKKEALASKSFKREYERYELAFEIGQMIVEARILKGITQSKLAQLIGTKQPSIARLEGGRSLPSLSFLEKIAKALNTYILAPRFAFMGYVEASYSISARDSGVYKALNRDFQLLSVELGTPKFDYSEVSSACTFNN